MAAEAGGLAQDRFRGNPELAGDLAGTGTGHQSHEQRQLKLGHLEPVVGLEGLGAEVALAVEAAPALDSARQVLALEEAGADETPLLTILLVKVAGIVRTERGLRGGRPLEHAKTLARFQKCNLAGTTGMVPM